MIHGYISLSGLNSFLIVQDFANSTAYSLLFLAILKSSSLGLYVNRSFVLYLSRDHLNTFRCTEVRAYVDTTKFQPSTILHSTGQLSCDYLKEVYMVKISSYRRKLVRQWYGRTLNGLGFKQIDNVFKGGSCLLKHLGKIMQTILPLLLHIPLHTE